MFDFRRITLFCLEKCLSKHKMTMFSKNVGGHGHFGPPDYAYDLVDVFVSVEFFTYFEIVHRACISRIDILSSVAR